MKALVVMLMLSSVASADDWLSHPRKRPRR